MQIKIGITRSPDWIKRERIATGENVPVMQEVEVDTSVLSQESRELLLKEGNGMFLGNYKAVHYTPSGEVTSNSSYGRVEFKRDIHSPNSVDVDLAIMDAAKEMAQITVRMQKEAINRKHNDEIESAKREAAKQKREEAKELLAAELKALEDCKAKLEVLSSFLASVPAELMQRAVFAAAKVQSNKQASKLARKLEDCSPYFIFNDFSVFEDEEQFEEQ